ncbi:hypothetical protein D3C85_1051390 [compost metagenome]
MREQFHHRHFHPLLALDGLGEDRCFFKLEPHVQADHDQGGTEQEGNAPAPGAELLIVQDHRQGQEQAIGSEKADRRSQLREHTEPGALAFGGILGGQQGRTAPFATQAQALAEAQHAEQDRCPGTNTVVAGEDADQRGADAHQQ